MTPFVELCLKDRMSLVFKSRTRYQARHSRGWRAFAHGSCTSSRAENLKLRVPSPIAVCYRRADPLLHCRRRSTFEVTVVDALGRRLAVPVDEMLAAGTYRLPFDATALARGKYLYRLATHESVNIRIVVSAN